MSFSVLDVLVMPNSTVTEILEANEQTWAQENKT